MAVPALLAALAERGAEPTQLDDPPRHAGRRLHGPDRTEAARWLSPLDYKIRGAAHRADAGPHSRADP